MDVRRTPPISFKISGMMLLDLLNMKMALPLNAVKNFSRYAQEYHVERYLREILIPRTAPVSPQMILNFIAEKALGLPKSY